jgi:hypothetical protein
MRNAELEAGRERMAMSAHFFSAFIARFLEKLAAISIGGAGVPAGRTSTNQAARGDTRPTGYRRLLMETLLLGFAPDFMV